MTRQRNRGLADGQPIRGDLIAVIDETVPEMGAGVYYIMTTAVMFDHAVVSTHLTNIFSDTPHRTRPFHWHKEGPAARNKMINLVINHGIIAHSRYQSVSRKGQTSARQILLANLAADLQSEGIEHLIIESVDSTTNSRDKSTLLTHFQDDGGVPFSYDWRSKQERLLWIADAVNGALHDHYYHNNPEWFDKLCTAGVLSGEPIYTN